MRTHYQHLGAYSDLVAAARRNKTLWPKIKPGKAAQKMFLNTLNFAPGPARPLKLKVEDRWTRDGVDGECLSWAVGYGPRTQAWVLRPAGAKGALPGVLALHDHGGNKYFGKEKIAEGHDPAIAPLLAYRRQYYGDRPYANELARRGFTVMVPDVFLWGSRKITMELMAKQLWNRVPLFDDTRPDPTAEEIENYNDTASRYEHVVEKYLAVLGTTLSALISFEDRVAAACLVRRHDVQPGGIGCVGLSGGGLRSCLLQATCTDIRAAVVVGLMATYASLLDHNICGHTWALHPRGWSSKGDWPDIPCVRAPSPLMVQYDREDELFTPRGMQAAHRHIRAQYRAMGKPENYTGKVYPGLHKFDREMQADAFGWLEKQLQR